MSRTIPHLQLLIPGLCGPLPSSPQLLENLANNQKLQSVYNALDKAHAQKSACDHLYPLLSQLFQLDIDTVRAGNETGQYTFFPSAAFSLLALCEQDNDKILLSSQQIKNLDVQHGYFMHADPVHLRAEMDHAILVGTADLNLSSAESNQLTETLHQHFSADGLEVFAMDANHWFVKVSEEKRQQQQDFATVSLADAVGRNVNFILPTGGNSTYWKQFLNESQMLLHMHENNQSREQQGQITLNSVWLHGAGCLPQIKDNKTDNKNNMDGLPTSALSSVCADDMLLMGLANYSGLPLYRPEAFESDASGVAGIRYYEKIKHQPKPLLYLDTLVPWLNYTESAMWQQQLEKIHDVWLKPLLDKVKQGKLRLSLYPCNDQIFDFEPYYQYKAGVSQLMFWQKTKINNYVSTY